MQELHEKFIHSRCCGAHWELVVKDNEWKLQCEKCGKSIGTEIKVTGPDLSNTGCEKCHSRSKLLN